MAETIAVDARGLSCPEPVLAAKRAIERAGSGEVAVLVDTVTSRENVKRYAENAGWSAAFAEEGGYWRVTLSK